MFRRLATILALLATCCAALAGSSINPNSPAQNSQLSSAVVRNNFLAAYTDINKILGKFASTVAPTTPTNLQDWVDTSASPIYTFKIWDSTTSSWVATATLNITTGAYSAIVSPLGVAATSPIVISYPSGVATLSCPQCAVKNASNTFTAAQAMNLNVSALPTPLAGTILQIQGADGVASRIELDMYSGAGIITAARANGTAASQSTLAVDNVILNLSGAGYDGTARGTGPSVGIRLAAADTWTVSSHPTYIDFFVTQAGSTLTQTAVRIENDGSITTAGAIGTLVGAGNLNLGGGNLYNNGTAPTGVGAYVRASAPTLNGPVLNIGTGSGAGTLGFTGAFMTLGNGSTFNNIVDDFTAQTIQNKTLAGTTLNSPVLNSPVFTSSSSNTLGQVGYGPINGTLNVGDGSSNHTLVATDLVQTLSSKTLVSPVLTGTTTSTRIAINGCTAGTDVFCVGGNSSFYNAVAISSASSQAFAVGPNGATNPSFKVSVGTTAGLNVVGDVTGGTVGINVIDSGANANLSISAKGSGSIAINNSIAYGGVTLANAVTGTGSMVLSASPSISGLTVTSLFTATGLVKNTDLVSPTTTVNGQACTLGAACTVTASATSVTVGSTTVASGTTNGVLTNNAGVLANTAAGTNGQLFLGVTSSQPVFATMSADATISNTGALTLATVNAGSGSVGSSTAIPVLTTNAKGLVTVQSTAAVIAPAGTLSGTTLNSTVVSSSLTSLGTITSLTATTINAFTLSGAISGGGNQINNVNVGVSSPGTGNFTTLAAVGETITAGILTGPNSALLVTATQPSTFSTQQIGVSFQITGAGSSAFTNVGLSVNYLPGYLGGNQTRAIAGLNTNAGTGNTLIPPSNSNGTLANFGVFGSSGGVTATGLNIGTWGSTGNGLVNIGVMGSAQLTANSATNVAVLGTAVNLGTGSVHQSAGYFTLNGTGPTNTTPSAALIADNGAQASAVLLGRVNGVTYLQQFATGGLGVGSAATDPGASNLQVSGTTNLLGFVAMGANLSATTYLTINANTLAPAALSTNGIHLVGADAGGFGITIDTYGTVSTGLFARKALGTSLSKSAVTADTLLVNNNGAGWNGASYTTGGAFKVFAAETYAGGISGGYVTLSTVVKTTATLLEAVRVQASGGVSIGLTAFNAANDPGAGSLIVTNAITSQTRIVNGTVPVGTTGSCVASSFAGGATAGTFAAAVCAAGTIILTALPAAPTGYVCAAFDRTTPANTVRQTATTTTSVTFQATTTAADAIQYSCVGY